MHVIKRDGREEPINITKLTARLKRLTYGFGVDHCDPVLVARKVCSELSNGVTTTRIDDLAAEIAISLSKIHPNYDLLAARIAVSSLHKNTNKSFSETIKGIYKHFEMLSGEKSSIITDDVYEIVMKNAGRLDSEIIYDRDFDYDYFGFKTIKSTYLLRIDGNVVERPQHMLMRVCVGIHKDDIESVIKTYHFMSQRCHACLALLTAGNPQSQECDAGRKSAEGLGIVILNQQRELIHNVFDETAGCADQGGSKFIGNHAIYLELWQVEIIEILNVKRTHGQEDQGGQVPLYALWIPDFFMERVLDDGKWSLFSPNESPDLVNCSGEDFEKLYTQHEEEGKANKVLFSRKLWVQILNSQIDNTATLHILFKDSYNLQNMSAEVMNCTTSSTNNVVYNLATIALSQFVTEKEASIDLHLSELEENSDTKNLYFDFEKLAMVTSTVAANMKTTNDFYMYLNKTVKRSNFQHNIPNSIGVQGLAETFTLLGMSFDSPEGWQLSKYIFETIREAGTVQTHPL